MRNRVIIVVAVMAALAAGFGWAYAGVGQGGLVSTTPVTNTPNILDGEVDTIAVVGDTAVLGGTFTGVRNATGGSTLSRHSILAYSMSTGAVTAFAPTLDGQVSALAAGPGGTVYVAGKFKHVNGVAHGGLAQIDLTTGKPVTSFTAGVTGGDARALASRGPWLYVGGTFTGIAGQVRSGLARFSTATGQFDTGFSFGLVGTTANPVKIVSIAVSNDGSHVAVAGAFISAQGEARAQLMLADGNGHVLNWSTSAYAKPCANDYDTYLRGVDFSADGSYFVVVTTGHNSGPTQMCDSAARFNVAGAGAHNPAWVNRTGGNTLWSVTVTDSAVYVGGHQQWMDNPLGEKTAGAGAVERPGIAAIDPVSGHALSWNPTHSRGVGVLSLVSCPQGLLVGSDTDQIGHIYHGRIGMLPVR